MGQPNGLNITTINPVPPSSQARRTGRTRRYTRGDVKMTYVYLRDLGKEQQTDSFLGKGTEELKEKARLQDKEVIVGVYYNKPRLER
jgi:hypothetical protein